MRGAVDRPSEPLDVSAACRDPRWPSASSSYPWRPAMSPETARQQQEDLQRSAPVRRMAADAREAGRGLPWHPSQGGSPPAADEFAVERQLSPDEIAEARRSDEEPALEETEATTFQGRLLRLYSVHYTA